MKKKTWSFTLLLTLLLIYSTTLPVLAVSAPLSGGDAPDISLTGPAAPDYSDAKSPDTNTSPIQGETQTGPQGPAEAPSGEAKAAPAPTPTKDKNSNTPFFIGVGVAVLMFAGVALYCKANGNKSF